MTSSWSCHIHGKLPTGNAIKGSWQMAGSMAFLARMPRGRAAAYERIAELLKGDAMSPARAVRRSRGVVCHH